MYDIIDKFLYYNKSNISTFVLLRLFDLDMNRNIISCVYGGVKQKREEALQ